MCGIVGFIGNCNARDIVIQGLERLEYRGYDSAGIAVYEDKINVYKDKGRVEALKNITKNVYSNLCIGHTRWATHGEVNKQNSHPHSSNSNRFFIVHNGIVENYRALKEQYLKDYNFYSQTDTEVIVNLIDYFSKSYNVIESLFKTVNLLEGSHTILLLDKDNVDKIYYAKNKTPLSIGKGENGYILASDTLALVNVTNNYFLVPDECYGYVDNKEIKCFSYKKEIVKIKYNKLNTDNLDVNKGDFKHFMLKEINEQPKVIKSLIDKYFVGEKVNFKQELLGTIINSKKINLVGSGTSMYACYMGKYFFEKFCNIPSEVFCASELVYSTPLILGKPSFIFVSQSGETADSISVLKRFKDNGNPIIVLSNNNLSTMSLLADFSLDLCAGKEVSVASTKAYIAEVVLMAILAFALSKNETCLKSELYKVSNVIDKQLGNMETYKNASTDIAKSKSIFYIGRGIDYWVSLEAALKMKEISYIHTEAFSSGELKHGAIALIDKEATVIAICSQKGTNSITRSNLEEAKSRGAKTYIISMNDLCDNNDDFIIEDVANYLTPLVTVVITQCLAYYVADYLGNDIDKPRNLAKSVTVE